MNTCQLAPRANPGGALPRRSFACLETTVSLARAARARIEACLGKVLLIGACIFAASHASHAFSAPSVTLAWDANPEPDISGYELRYGGSPGNYSSVVDVGNTTTTEVAGLTLGQTYYFTVSAYNSAGLKSPPSPEISYTFVVVPTGTSSVHYVDSEDPDGYRAEYAIDGDPNTFWHTEWRTNAPPPPHELQIDLGSVQDLRGFRYLPRQDAYDNGNISDYEFYVSMDGIQWGVPVASGTFPNSKVEKEVLFNPTSGRYVRLRALSDVLGTTVTNVAELTLLQADDLPTVTPSNDAPVSIAKFITTPEDTAVSVVLSATDADGDALTYSVVASPAHGSLSGTPPILTYTPSANFHGSDSFSFRANDGSLDSGIAIVSITVIPVNDAPSAVAMSLTTAEDTPLDIVLTGNDTEGASLKYSVLTQPVNGSLSGVAPNLIYTPSPDFHGSDTFTFNVNDGSLSSAPATVSIIVTPGNDAPSASAQAVSAIRNTALPILLSGNDKDGDSITYSIVNGPANGSLSGTPPNLTYTPTTDFVGSDQFTFNVNDGKLTSSVATVSISVSSSNSAPVALAGSITTNENESIPVVLVGTDPDGDALTYSVVSSPSKGKLTYSVASGSSSTAPGLTYTPAADFSGTDSFSFRVNDGSLDSAPATVFITIAPTNKEPENVAPAFTQNAIFADATENKAFAGQLAATDANAGDTFTFSKISGPAWLNVSASGALSGTPLATHVGTNSFSVMVMDSANASATASLTITVTKANTLPVALAGSITTAENESVPVVLNGTDMESDPLTYSVASGPSKGKLTYTLAGGSQRKSLGATAPGFTYTPSRNFSGTDSFTFIVNDGRLDSAPATIIITITPAEIEPENVAPVFAQNPIVASATENSAFSGQLAATDANPGDTLTFSKVSGPAWLNVSSAGVMSGTPTASDVGSNSFSVMVKDSADATATASLTISVAKANSAPVFVQNPILLADAKEGSAYTGQSLAGLATDADQGDILTFSKFSGPAWLSIASNGALAGTPPTDSSGLNEFIARVTDKAGAFSDAVLQIQVAKDGLPLPWSVDHIGVGNLTGTALFAAGTFTMTGSGALAGNQDGSSFCWQTLSGDGEIIAKLRKLDSKEFTPRVGVMIRESLAPNSRNSFLGISGDGNFRFYNRTITGGSTSIQLSGNVSLGNTWVRLVRNGNVISSYKSTKDGNWIPIGSVTMELPANCYIGLTTSSGKDDSLLGATFTNVTVIP